MKYIIFIPALIIASCCCLPKKKNKNSAWEENYDQQYEQIEYPEEEYAEDVVWDAEDMNRSYNWFKNYKTSKDIVWDLLNTNLELALDFENAKIEGLATLKLKPYYYSQDSLVLDAKALNIDYIKDADTKADLGYKISNDAMQVVIYLPKKYIQNEILNLSIKYNTGGSDVGERNDGPISGDAGFYFINTDLKRPIARQFWTQGETESNSRWFPTLDAPNQKHTHTISVSVPDTMKVLSNGVKLSEIKVGGKKKVVWQQKKEHAVYLTMLAVGNWSVVQDKPWKGKEINYWVDPDFTSEAKNIFGNTPEMIDFFSNYLGVDYPWEKYSQVVVHDFVSGAMENTSATVHMEGLQQTSGERIDHSLEDYVSHELFHQWFGDLATAESWANITLNESFATYGEYLWKAHKYGEIAADETLNGFRTSYDNYGSYSENTLLRHNYSTPNDVFDVTSYQKGALTLHLLRWEIGDKAFKESLKLYLTRHAYKNTEVDQLRLCIEEVTGRDMAWFFKQWYTEANYPQYEISFLKDQNNNYFANISSNSSPEYYPHGKVKIKYFQSGIAEEKDFLLDGPDAKFNFGPIKPDWFVIDPERVLLGELKLNTGTYAKTSDIDDYQEYKDQIEPKGEEPEGAITEEGEDGLTNENMGIEKALDGSDNSRNGFYNSSDNMFYDIIPMDADFLFNAYKGISSPSAKTVLLTAYDEIVFSDIETAGDEPVTNVIAPNLMDIEIIKDAISSGSANLMNSATYFKLFSDNFNLPLANAIGQPFFLESLHNRKLPSSVRANCLDVLIKMGYTGWEDEFINDPSNLVSKKAIENITDSTILLGHMDKGIRSLEPEVAMAWYMQWIYYTENDSAKIHWLKKLLAHPKVNIMQWSSKISKIYQGSDNVLVLTQVIIDSKNGPLAKIAADYLTRSLRYYDNNAEFMEEDDIMKDILLIYKESLDLLNSSDLY